MSVSVGSVMLPLIERDIGDGGVQRGDYVFRQLLEDIAAGRYKPGDKLAVEELAEAYGVSVTPVRDALTRLASNDVAEKRPYQGFYVRTFSPKEIQDLYEVRLGLEVLAASLACQRHKPEHIEQLRALLKQGAAALANDDLPQYKKTNYGFHATLIEASGNDLLRRKMNRISVQLHLMITQTVNVPGRPDRASQEHLQILEHVERRDEAAAEAAVKRHIYSALQDLGLDDL